MTLAVPGQKMAIGAIVAGIGGLVSIVGAFLPAESVSFMGMSESASFFDGNAGKTVCVVSIIALALVAAWLFGRTLPINKGAAKIVIIIAGAVVLLVFGANYGDITKDVDAANKIAPGAASVGIGVYAVLLGGIMLVAGGVLGLVQKD